MKVLQCQYCGEDVERSRVMDKVTCFLCKMDMVKARYYKGPGFRHEIPKFDKSDKSARTNLSRKKEDKKCIVCGIDMPGVHFTRLYCSSKCQTLKYKKYDAIHNTNI